MVNSRKAGAGFTLIELIIVLIIIGLASGVVGLVISRSSGNFELKSISKELSAVMRLARNRAITEKRTYCFVIDINERMYNLSTDKREDDKDKEDTDDNEKIIRVVNKPFPKDLQMSVMGGDSDSQIIEFFADGSSTGGVIEVSGEKGAVYHITVNRITGRVDVERGES
ncbi:MAG: GspH/FimT family pseudopilin [Nitrospirae bacterium]|nr:GspH/FimT family pseudopilin [Nitrospirota bacterium]